MDVFSEASRRAATWNEDSWALNHYQGEGIVIRDGCNRPNSCLTPSYWADKWYSYDPTWSDIRSETGSTSTTRPSTVEVTEVNAGTQWEDLDDKWDTRDSENMKTWSNLERSAGTLTHDMKISWREADKRDYYVANNSYCVGTITNALKGAEGERNEINAYEQERRSEAYILNAEFWFTEVSEGIQLYTADWLREGDWNLYEMYDTTGTQRIQLPELIEEKGSSNWECGWYRWVAINTGASDGQFTLEWQGAAALQATVAALAYLLA